MGLKGLLETSVAHIHFWFKSDQNGIERVHELEMYCIGDCSSNQTKMGLKASIPAMTSPRTLIVQIRPKWD